MPDQDLKTTENLNPVSKLGEYAIEGGPGRPKGLKNRYSLIKNEILDVWEEEKGKEKFRQLLNSGTRDYIKALHIIVALLPKEPTMFVEKEVQKFLVTWSDGQVTQEDS